MRFGMIGSGSWATALTKMLTDNMHTVTWWVRNTATIDYLHKRKHNPHYLSTAYFNTALLDISSSIAYVAEKSEVLVIACPSAYVHDVLSGLNKDALRGKKVVSAVKGILPDSNLLLNEYLYNEFDLGLEDYFAVLGPCHAEEVAAEKLSYLTFAGVDELYAREIGDHFTTDYINTVVTHDVIGVQYAAVLKNVYALGAGIAHGLEYGDNFQSVYIAKCADEMVGFLRRVYHANNDEEKEHINYAASAYLGDLLVTCYSLYSRNRTFGNMIGKGYSVKAAQLELNMVAEGYNASRCMFKTNETVGAPIPVLTTIYQILWEHLPAMEGFKTIEGLLV